MMWSVLIKWNAPKYQAAALWNCFDTKDDQLTLDELLAIPGPAIVRFIGLS